MEAHTSTSQQVMGPVTKFNGQRNQWKSWSRTFQSLMILKGWGDILEEDEITEMDQKESSSYKQKNKLIWASLRISLDDEVVEWLDDNVPADCKDGRLAWLKLKERYNEIDVNHIHLLLEQLIQIRIQPW